MLYHAHFKEINCITKELQEALGSDAIFTLDGRNNIETMIKDAEKRMFNLRKVKDYIGFNIYKGNLRERHFCYRSI